MHWNHRLRATMACLALLHGLAGTRCALGADDAATDAGPSLGAPRSVLMRSSESNGPSEGWPGPTVMGEPFSGPPAEAAPFGPGENGQYGIYEPGGCDEGCCTGLPGGFRFRHAGRGDPDRHVGLGEPLQGTSWLNRPWHVDWFVGGMFADELIADRIDQRDGMFGGIRLGYDFDHYWGWEVRWQDPTFDLVESGVTVERAAYDYFLDVEVLYYPWGDARWRPYVTLGLGFTGFRFYDDHDRQIDQTLLNLPVGVGLKYLMTKNCVLRFDLVDNIAFSNAELQTMNNVQFTGGMEFHFGGTRTSYYPWNPSIHLQ